MSRVIMHCDANGFYAACELVYRPELRGLPVSVGGDVEARHGIVLASTPEAKRCGVKTGMVLWQARQLFRDRGYAGMLPLRSIGVSVGSLIPDDSPVQMDLLGDAARRERELALAHCVDDIRRRYGTQTIRRGSVLARPVFAAINPKDDHTIHPVPFYAG